MTIKDLIKHLQEYYTEDMHVAAPIWEADDVKDRAMEIGQTLTSNEADAVIDLVENHHDCEMGISWTTLDCWIEETIRMRGEE